MHNKIRQFLWNFLVRNWQAVIVDWVGLETLVHNCNEWVQKLQFSRLSQPISKGAFLTFELLITYCKWIGKSSLLTNKRRHFLVTSTVCLLNSALGRVILLFHEFTSGVPKKWKEKGKPLIKEHFFWDSIYIHLAFSPWYTQSIGSLLPRASSSSVHLWHPAALQPHSRCIQPSYAA